jgi:hypothetical protein
MSDVWSQWEGHVIDGAYPLLRCLGASDHSGVFLTEHPSGGLPKAALKLMPAIPSLTEAQLSHWRAAAVFSHPRLIRLFDAGRCQLGERHFLFVVMEYSDQNLAEVLLHRALTPDEAREMLLPTLDALSFLHGRKRVQGQLKPSNILVVGDQLKVASDTIRPASEAAANIGTPSVYDAPEMTGEIFTTASDIWALGVTLVEALTRQPPSWSDAQRERLVLGADFPPAFAEAVRRCLHREPAGRPDIASLTSWLEGKTKAPTAAGRTAEATPAEVEVLLESPAMARAAAPAQAQMATRQAATARAGATPRPTTPVQTRPAAPAPRAPNTRPVSATAAGAAPPAAQAQRSASAGSARPASREPAAASRPAPAPPQLSRAALIARATLESVEQDDSGWRRRIPMIAGAVLAIVAVWAAFHLFSSHTNSPPQAVSTSPATTGPATPPEPAAVAPASPPAAPSKPPSRAAAPAAASASVVQHEEMPNASHGARNTIHGHIRVAVRVTVDKSGNVVNETFDDPGPSPYFARISIQAARKWKFSPSDEKSRQWVLHFEFSREGTTGDAAKARSR